MPIDISLCCQRAITIWNVGIKCP